MEEIITSISVRDIRFPTSLEKDGSDATNKNPDYSCPYVTLTTSAGNQGYGITFTVGRGNNIVCDSIRLISKLVVGKKVSEIQANFGPFWKEITNEDQMRWLGPDKGVMHMAVAAVVNAFWDLWAKMEGKPLWKLLVSMSPEQLVSSIDFTYLGDALTKQEALGLYLALTKQEALGLYLALTKQEALDILKKMAPGKNEREAELKKDGYPAYTTSCAWLGYDDEKIIRLCKEAQAQGFSRFKMKVGTDIEDDIRRVQILRKTMAPNNLLMVDANQKWEVPQAIEWMKKLADFKITWIEEPTSPDDVQGHLTISKALAPYGIGVATGEQCHNRVMFKQFLSSGAMQYCQIDSCRLGGVSENLAVILMAKKFGVPVCPHGGGVGLCEYIQHLSIFDYITVSGSLDKRMTEYTDHLHEHFIHPCKINNGCYVVPEAPGYSIDMKDSSLDDYEWPTGKVWKDLINSGTYQLD